MSECLCETCPFGSPNLTYAAVHCLHRFKAWPTERAAGEDLPLKKEPAAKPVWQASAAMPHLFVRLAA